MPKVTDSAATTPFVGFGKMKAIYIGDRRKMQVATSEHAAFETDEIKIRVTQREGIYVAPIADELARLVTAA